MFGLVIIMLSLVSAAKPLRGLRPQRLGRSGEIATGGPGQPCATGSTTRRCFPWTERKHNQPRPKILRPGPQGVTTGLVRMPTLALPTRPGAAV
jgi:hypothetical protein